MEQKNFSLFLIKLLYMLVSIISVLNVFEAKKIISILFSTILVIILLLFLKNMELKMKLNDWIALAIIFFSLANLVSYLLFNCDVTLPNLKKLIIFSITILYFNCVSKLKVEKNTVKFIELTINFTSVAFLLFFFIKRSELYVTDINGVSYLYFNFDNSNFASLFFMIYSMFHVCFTEKSTTVIKKVFHLMLAMFMLFLVYETICRNSILLLILYLMLAFTIKLKKYTGKRYSKSISLFISLWPLSFSIIYVLFIDLINNKAFSFFKQGGKQLDTRMSVWSTAFNKLWESPLIGDYAFAVLRQSHNILIDIWISYGFIPLILTVVFIANIFNNDDKVYENKNSFLCITGFVCCIATGMAEAALFIGSQGVFVLAAAFIIFARYYESENVD